ncbi:MULTISPECIES: hypothetical protein [Halorussus]|uniref:hypothetical protein n=1 Tax=Halorussus TaxID=1070314 RepID=UPI00209EE914|nr:hypothetical protein [Halorussus vallis]USZ73929.1 hypothetical protein NGM07_10715 [Halorussus vallis]
MSERLPAERFVDVVRSHLSVAGIGLLVAAGFAAYFVLVVPDELATLLVGGAAALALASYAPVFSILAVSWLHD